MVDDDGPWIHYKLTNEPKGSGCCSCFCSLDFFSDNIDPHASSTTNGDRHSQIEIVQCIINNLLKKKKKL